MEFRHFDGDREEVIEESMDRIDGLVCSSIEMETVEQVLGLHREYPGFVFACLGLHPPRSVEVSEGYIDEHKQLIRDNVGDIVAVGEVGLDYYHLKDSGERERSKEVFREYIDLSNELQLPLVVHSRDSMGDVLDILEGEKEEVLIHCFAGNEEHLEEALDRDYYLSFGGMIFRAPNKYKKLLRKTPLDNLLLETDAPFLAKKKRNRSNPWFIKEIAQKIAEIKKNNFNQIWRKAKENAKEIFKIKPNKKPK
uniref:Deoxyribonuclease, TatD Mg-dependent n=1 Tax=uncultured organism TaxID=155900 RepID=M1QAT2_9ZZZZ|nr:deoxyribonuclease, TatD Mg-dependent [uncultured organism]